MSTSFDIGKLGRGFVNFFSNLTLALGTITIGVFLLGGGGDMFTVLTSQSLLAVFVRGFVGTVPRYLARPPLFLCTVGGLRNSVVVLATSTDIVSDVFFSYRERIKNDINRTNKKKKTTTTTIIMII